jgi:hypothetical protein
MIIPSAALLFASASVLPAAPRGPSGSTPALRAPVSMTLTMTQAQAQPQPPAQPQSQGGEVKLNVDVRTDRVWYADPFWITIGVVALLVIVLIAVMASRGGGTTTVVR